VRTGIHNQRSVRRDSPFVITVLVTVINISTLPRLSPEQVRGDDWVGHETTILGTSHGTGAQ
jgi:hypothetical protein